MKQKAFLFGYNAPDFRSMAEIVKDSFNPSTTDPNPNTEWQNLTISGVSGEEDTIHLDAIYSRIVKGHWIILAKSDYEEVYEVDKASESSRKDFTLASKTTKLKLKGENLESVFDNYLRDTVVFAQSEEFEVADKPITETPTGKVIRLEKVLPDLKAGKIIIISGKRRRLVIAPIKTTLQLVSEAGEKKVLSPGDSLIITNIPGVNGSASFQLVDRSGFMGSITLSRSQWEFTDVLDEDETLSEVNTILDVQVDTYSTTLTLETNLDNFYDPASVIVYANVATATHGETREESLGSGNGSLIFQKFDLKQKPLTYVSAASATGIETTLEIRVNNILWKEVSSFFGTGPKDKVYTVTINDDGKVTVQFGDGITGARLPTGSENVKAKYRVGIGTDGMLKASALSMLMTPQLGVSKVTNPLPTSGAENRETMEGAKRNLPFSVLTLERIVSIKDFEDFAAAFAGISKSRADLIWDGEEQSLVVTIASAETPDIKEDSDLYINLFDAIKSAGKFYRRIYLKNYENVLFTVSAKINVDRAYLFDDVKKRVLSALNETYSFEARDFGQDITPAEVIATIQRVEGVVYVDLDLLNNKEPFEQGTHFRIPSETARFYGATILPAQLLTIDPERITISEILI